MSTEKIVSGLVSPEENLITQLAGYVHGGRSMQMTTLVGVLQLLERQTAEIISLNQQLSAHQLSQQNIINSFGISGEGAHSKLVIEYVHGLVAENATMREAIDETIGWQESVDASNTESVRLLVALQTPNTDTAIAEIREQSVIIGIDFVRNMLIDYVEREVGPNKNVPGLIKAAEKCVDLAANLLIELRARRNKEQPHD